VFRFPGLSVNGTYTGGLHPGWDLGVYWIVDVLVMVRPETIGG
jgi:hypothetical protein